MPSTTLISQELTSLKFSLYGDMDPVIDQFDISIVKPRTGDMDIRTTVARFIKHVQDKYPQKYIESKLFVVDDATDVEIETLDPSDTLLHFKQDCFIVGKSEYSYLTSTLSIAADREDARQRADSSEF
jgi:hypothetical protein